MTQSLNTNNSNSSKLSEGPPPAQKPILLSGMPFNSENAIDEIVRFYVKDIDPILPDIITKNLAVSVTLKTGKTIASGFLEVDSLAKLEELTDDVNAKEALNANLSRVFLVDATKLGDAQTMENLSKKAFTLLVSSNTANVKLEYKGVVVNVIKALEADSKENPKNAITIVDAGDGFAGYLMGKFLTQPDWSAMQYTTYSNFKVVLKTNADVDKARLLGYTFLYHDETTVKQPTLFYMMCGKEPATKPYITKDIELEVQTAIVNYIQVNNPKYNNEDIRLLKSYANDVLKKYIGKYITSDSYLDIEAVENQKEDDYIKGFVEGAKLKLVFNTPIWKIEGEIEAILGRGV